MQTTATAASNLRAKHYYCTSCHFERRPLAVSLLAVRSQPQVDHGEGDRPRVVRAVCVVLGSGHGEQAEGEEVGKALLLELTASARHHSDRGEHMQQRPPVLIHNRPVIS